jgi:hypothetical protein
VSANKTPQTIAYQEICDSEKSNLSGLVITKKITTKSVENTFVQNVEKKLEYPLNEGIL